MRVSDPRKPFWPKGVWGTIQWRPRYKVLEFYDKHSNTMTVGIQATMWAPPPRYKSWYEKAGLILMDGQGRVLLIHGVGGKWSFPKGHVEEIDEENPLMTATRETQEEVGLGPMDYQLLSPVPIAFPFKTYFYVGMATPMTVPYVNDGEGTEVRWFGRTELAGMWNDLNMHVKHYMTGRR